MLITSGWTVQRRDTINLSIGMTIVKFFFDDFRVDNLGGVSDYHRLSLVIAHLKYQLWEL